MNTIKSILNAPNAPRALLVSLGRDGQIKHQPVATDASVLSIESDLIDHLNEYPHSSDFLETLRAYCAGRLAARQEARATGGIVRPNGMRFEIHHTNAFNHMRN